MSSRHSAGEFADSVGVTGRGQRLSGPEEGNCGAAEAGEKAGKTALLVFKSSRHSELGCELCAASDSGITVTLLHGSASKMGATRKICTNLSKGLVLWGKVTLNAVVVLVLSLLMDKRGRFLFCEFVQNLVQTV